MDMRPFTPDIAHLLGEDRRPETERAAAAGPRNGSKSGQKDTHLSQAIYHDPDGLLGDVSPLDLPLSVTRFANVKARNLSTDTLSLRTLASVIRRMRAHEKKALPLLKLGTFGDSRTAGGSLRHDANLVRVSGIEGDYDDGQITPQEAAARLEVAGIAGLIYTTPSHTADAPRWRVLAPLSRNVSPAERDALCARVNGALGGILAGESFTLSQSYYFGGVTSDPVVHLVEGRAVDEAADVPSIGKTSHFAVGDMFADLLGEDEAPVVSRQAVDWAKVKRALDVIPASVPYTTWGKVVGFALEHAGQGSSSAFKLFDEWSRTCPGSYPGGREMRSLWASFTRSRISKEANGQTVTTLGSLFAEAEKYGFEHLPPDEFENLEADFEDQPDATKPLARFGLMTPDECDLAPCPRYLVKGIVSERHVMTIVGEPGAGKSLLAPAMGYAIAQGRQFMGRRVRQGRVLYIACEDLWGMQQRVKALRKEHGPADDFKLVNASPDLLNSREDLTAIRAIIKEYRPAFVVVDTLAAAFPGVEENSPEGMGKVVGVLRSFTEWGATVACVTHPVKNASVMLPRGHGILNGDVDTNLFLMRDGSDVTGGFTKNRSGASDQAIHFRVGVMELGRDDDGDPITAAYCHETDDAPTLAKPKLSAAERATLDVIRDAGGEVSEVELRPLCVEGRKVSASDNPDSRRRVVDRALKGLIQKGSVIFQDGTYRIWGDDTDDFDDLSEPDNPDSVRTSPEMSGMAKRRNPDGLGLAPLGESGCPDDAGEGVL